MADGILIYSGEQIATDDAGASGHLQLFKLGISADGSPTLIPATAARGLLVQTQTAVVLSGTVTRPATTTPYAAGDALTNSTSAPTTLSIAGAVRANGGSGRITSLLVVDSANQPTKPALEVWILRATITPDNDNAVFTPTDAECATVAAIVPVSTWIIGDATAGAGGNLVGLADSGYLPAPFVCEAGSTNLYVALVVRNAYTPISSEGFTVVLGVEQD